jgi:hypothetical protein
MLFCPAGLTGPVGGSGYVLARSFRCAQTFGLNIPTPKLRKQPERYDKLDLMFSTFIYLALCVIAVCSLIPGSVNRP